jgi:hypothetical protein
VIRGTLELQACHVAVTPNSVVLTTVSTEGKTYTVTMPRGMGETLMHELAFALQSMPAARPGAARPAPAAEAHGPEGVPRHSGASALPRRSGVTPSPAADAPEG